MDFSNRRFCYRCHAEILESMGSVLARDIFAEPITEIRELCGHCVGILCYARDDVVKDHEDYLK